MSAKLLPTSLVGSWPQPDWLIDRARLSKMVPRVRMDDLWLPARKDLQAKQDEAVLAAIRDQEEAGLDIITDGEQPHMASFHIASIIKVKRETASQQFPASCQHTRYCVSIVNV